MSTHFACENVFTKQLIELLLIFITNSGDIEQNHGPEKQKFHVTFCNWNLNGLMTRNFIKVSLLQTPAVTSDYDIICLTETFLDSSFDNDDDRISIPGFNIAQKMKFSIKDFFRKCDQIHRKLRIWSHLLKKSLMENFILCAV